MTSVERAAAAPVAGGPPSAALRPVGAVRATELYHRLQPAVAEVAGSLLEAVRDDEGAWHCRAGGPSEATVRATCAAVLEGRRPAAAQGWAGVFDLGAGDARRGLMLVSAAEPPRPSRLLRLQVIALQCRVWAACVASAALCERARRLVAEVAAVSAENEALRSLHLAQRRLAAAVGAGRGVPGVLRALGEITGRAVAMWAGGEQVAAFWPGDPGEPGDAGGEGWAEPALPRPLVEGRAVRGDGWLCCAVRRPDGALAVVGVRDPAGGLDGVAAVLLEDAAAVTALGAPAAAGPPEGPLWGDLADALVQGRDAARARALAGRLGYDLDRPHQVGVVSCEAPPGRVAAAARWAAGTGRATVLVTAHRAGAAVVTADRLDWEGLVADLRARLDRPGVVVGTGGWRERAEELGAGLEEAEAALRLAVGGHRAVVHFDDLGVVRILASNGDTADLRRFVDRWLGSLRDYDARRGADLVRTLSVYLDSGGAVGRSAEALIVHPSTLKYRLARVQELTGLDLGDADTRFHLQLAARAHAALVALGAEPPAGPARAPGA